MKGSNCTNVCGLTMAALKEAGETGLEVRRPSGTVPLIKLEEGEYKILGPSSTGDEPLLWESHDSLGALKKALRRY